MKSIEIKYLLLLWIFLLISMITWSQQIPKFRHGIFGNYFTNPAFGLDSYKPEFILNHRTQWLGFEGSPQTSSFSASHEFYPNMAGGLIFMHDKTGAMSKSLLNLSYTYQLHINTEWKLSFGLAWSMMQTGIDGSRINLHDNTDEVVFENLSDHVWKPDANTGLLISSTKFYAGFSVMQLFESKYRLYKDYETEFITKRHYFFNSGYYHPLGRSQSSVLNPFINMEFVPATPTSIDIGIQWEYNNSFMAGLSFSIKNAIITHIGYKYRQWTFVYSYDLIINNLTSVTSSVHEITLAYNLELKKVKTYTPMF
jgi:type IX secretion system PorP/SprF family membrane protein